MKFHETTIPLLPRNVQECINDALVALYRQSAALDEQGRCYVMWFDDPAKQEMRISFLRTPDPVPVAAVQAMYKNFYELTDDQVLDLWKQA